MTKAPWSAWLAPSLDDVEALARDIFQTLPEAFRARCEGLIIQVEDFPSEDVCQDMDLDSPYELLGLYRGVDLTRKSVLDTIDGPDMVFLYRRPMLDVWGEGDETLGALVTHVLVHEIGHHFGLSDEDMDAIEEAAVG